MRLSALGLSQVGRRQPEGTKVTNNSWLSSTLILIFPYGHQADVFCRMEIGDVLLLFLLLLLLQEMKEKELASHLGALSVNKKVKSETN